MQISTSLNIPKHPISRLTDWLRSTWPSKHTNWNPVLPLGQLSTSRFQFLSHIKRSGPVKYCRLFERQNSYTGIPQPHKSNRDLSRISSCRSILKHNNNCLPLLRELLSHVHLFHAQATSLSRSTFQRSIMAVENFVFFYALEERVAERPIFSVLQPFLRKWTKMQSKLPLKLHVPKVLKQNIRFAIFLVQHYWNIRSVGVGVIYISQTLLLFPHVRLGRCCSRITYHQQSRS